jgi:pyruvate ferredoxin oxidoreductase alpha subunit
MRRMLTGNATAAWGARISEVEYIGGYPITPQSEVVELLSKWVAEGTMNAVYTNYESEHSMFAGVGAASLSGVRAFTSTSSQGLMFAIEMLYAIAGWRAPVVFVNVARGLGMPMILQVEHGDIMGIRDTGFLQLHAETCQELLDFVPMAYRIGEDRRVMLPVAVNMDGFLISFGREPVDVPDKELVRDFLPKYNRPYPVVDFSNPVAYAPTIVDGYAYMYFKEQLQKAQERAREVFYEAAADFERIIGRRYEPIERYMLDDADYAIVSTGSYSTIIRGAVRRLRERGERVGMARIRMFRPFPRDEFVDALSGLKGVAVFDQNISLGKGGAIYTELAEALYHAKERPRVLMSFIGGLGGAEISFDAVRYMLDRLKDAVASGEEPRNPNWLFSEEDRRRLARALRLTLGEEVISG